MKRNISTNRLFVPKLSLPAPPIFFLLRKTWLKPWLNYRVLDSSKDYISFLKISIGISTRDISFLWKCHSRILLRISRVNVYLCFSGRKTVKNQEKSVKDRLASMRKSIIDESLLFIIEEIYYRNVQKHINNSIRMNHSSIQN